MAKSKKTPAPKAAFSVEKKRNGKFFVRARGGKIINGIEKTQILLDKGLIKTGLPKKQEEEVAAAEAPEKEADAKESATADEAPAAES